MVLLTAAAPVRADENHKDWFTKPLDDAAYAAALEKTSALVEEKLKRPNHGPATTYGVLVKEVNVGGQADRIGLEEGSMIIAVDDVPVFERADYIARRLDPPRVTLTWITPTGDKKQAAVQRGLIGVQISDARELVAWYARSDRRNDAWDEDLYGALVVLEKWFTQISDEEIDFVETALSKAVDAGMPLSDFLRSLKAELVWLRGTPVDAWPYIKTFKTTTDTTNPIIVPSRRLNIARAVNASEYAADIVRFGLINTQSIADPDALKQWLEDAPKLPMGPTPAQIVDKGLEVKATRVNKKAVPDPEGPLHHNSNWLANMIANSKPAKISVQPAHYRCTVLRQTDLFDYDITIKFRVKPTGPSNKRYPNFLTLGVYDREYVSEKRLGSFDACSTSSFVQIEFPDKTPAILNYGASPFYKSFLRPQTEIDKTGKTLHTIRMTHLIGNVQIQIDGVTVLNTYTNPTSGDMLLFLHAVGIEVTDLLIDIDKIDWNLKNAG